MAYRFNKSDSGHSGSKTVIGGAQRHCELVYSVSFINTRHPVWGGGVKRGLWSVRERHALKGRESAK